MLYLRFLHELLREVGPDLWRLLCDGRAPDDIRLSDLRCKLAVERLQRWALEARALEAVRKAKERKGEKS